MIKRIASTMLTFSLLCSMAGEAYATDAGTGGANASDAADTSSEEESEVGADFITDAFRSITMTRWTKVNSVDELKSEKAMPVMLVRDGSYVALRQNSGVYFSKKRQKQNGKDAEVIDREPGLGTLRSGYESYYDNNPKNKDETYLYDEDHDNDEGYFHMPPDYTGNLNYAFEVSDYMIAPDKAINAESKDSQIHFDRDTFFTNDDRNVPYIRYRGVTGDHHKDMWDFYVENKSIKETYYLDVSQPEGNMPYPYDNNMEYNDMGIDDPELSAFSDWTYYRGRVRRAYLKITRKSDNASGDGVNIDKVGDKFAFCAGGSNEFCLALENGYISARYVFGNVDKKMDDLLLGNSWYLYHSGSSYQYPFRPGLAGFTVYRGENIHFSQLKGNTTVNDGQLLRISTADYVDDEGNNSSTNGCFIPNGATLTVNKGGMLVISGNLINNGTIINNGGTILIKDGGSISPFSQGSNISKNGCGTLKCNGGDIIIQKGGAIYAGMNDTKGNPVPFTMTNNSTLINAGLLVYGKLQVLSGSRVELRRGSNAIGQVFSYSVKAYPRKEYDPSQVWMSVSDIKERYPGATNAADYLTGEDADNDYGYVFVLPALTKKTVDQCDYDILSNYNSVLQSATSIPDSCRGLHVVTDNGGDTSIEIGGMIRGNNATIIQYNGASITDGQVKDVLKKESLLID